MSKIHNKRLFLEKSAELFRKKKIDSFPYDPFKPRFRPEEYYTSGHCAEFAYSFAKFAKDNGIEPTVTVIYSNQYDGKTDEHIGKVLSHCVVEIEHEGKTISFDINGDEATQTWLIKVDYIYHCSPMNYKLEFERMGFEDSYERLQEICSEQNVPFDKDEIALDIDVFDSIRNSKQCCNELSA